MPYLTTCPKIRIYLEKVVINKVASWLEMLRRGDISSYEKELSESFHSAYNMISEELLASASEQVYDQLVDEGKGLCGRKIEIRSLQVKIGTGHKIKVMSPYVKQLPSNWEGPRHLLANHWHLIGGSTPALYDKVGYASGLSPSYDIAHQSLMKFGVKMSLSSVRELTNKLADHCYDYGEENLSLKSQESLAGKRVVISTDGGRTRTRDYGGDFNDQGNATYETPWREPKLFVIDVLNDKGSPDQYELPIYGCRFSENDMLDLLGRYLKKLKIDKAEHVQILADGAPWIWNHIKPLLEQLGVKSSRITQTLDYYHASEYVHDLVSKMPKRVGKTQAKEYLTQFKEWLWEGKSNLIVEQANKIFKRPCKLVKRWINYLDKHQDKTQYANYEEDKLMCGSGIIESAVRRIVNLKFKNASTFWKKEIVEKLYFLRASLLAKRWDTLIFNLANSSQ